jgi:hypothetical protein
MSGYQNPYEQYIHNYAFTGNTGDYNQFMSANASNGK